MAVQVKEADKEKAKNAFKLATRTTCTTAAGVAVGVTGTHLAPESTL